MYNTVIYDNSKGSRNQHRIELDRLEIIHEANGKLVVDFDCSEQEILDLFDGGEIERAVNAARKKFCVLAEDISEIDTILARYRGRKGSQLKALQEDVSDQLQSLRNSIAFYLSEFETEI